jgi:hypothetical protein
MSLVFYISHSLIIGFVSDLHSQHLTFRQGFHPVANEGEKDKGLQSEEAGWKHLEKMCAKFSKGKKEKNEKEKKIMEMKTSLMSYEYIFLALLGAPNPN